jgi:hypothetical protein
MARDILSEYGPDSPADQKPRATNGGQMPKKDLPYDPPKGPTGHMQSSVGLHGTNHGCAVNQGKH